MRLQEVRCPVERRSGLVEEARVRLEDVRDARGDLERDRDIGRWLPVPASRTASLSRTSWEPTWMSSGGKSAEIAEDRADIGVSGVGAPDVVGNPGTEPFGTEEWVDVLLLGE